MSHLSKRLVGVAASTVLLSLVSAAANAQTKFHNQFDGDNISTGNFWISQYKFYDKTLGEQGFCRRLRRAGIFRTFLWKI